MRKVLFILLLASLSSLAQDVHFSQFFMVPLGQNPAGIGAFEGDYRIHGVFRQQWRSVTVPYRTFGLGGDARNVKDLEGVGAGLWIYNDRAGDGELNTFHIDIGGSYEYELPDAEGHVIRAGLQIGYTNINLDPSQFQWDSQYNGSVYDPGLPTGEVFAQDVTSHIDFHTGFLYRYFGDHRNNQQAGIALYNLNKPEIGFLNRDPARLNSRLVVHGQIHRPFDPLWDAIPMVQFQSQGQFTEFIVGGSVRRILYDQYGFVQAVRAGLYYRSADAGYIFAGLDQGDWQFGLSYDINLSDLVPASRNRGGIEMTAIRIIRTRPVPKKYRACPTDI